MSKEKISLANELSPLALFLGHSLGAALGFVCIALIAAIPIFVIKALTWLGMSDLAQVFHHVETVILLVDVILFVVVFLAGAAIFAVETVLNAKRRIGDLLKG